MSLRAIQKRDREKLSSSQRLQLQRPSPGVGAAPMATAIKLTAAASSGSVPSVHSILQQSQHATEAARRNSAGRSSGETVLASHKLRRSSSYPVLPTRRKQQRKLRPVRSESDLSVLRDGAGDHRRDDGGSSSFAGPGSGSSFSTNNLYLGAKSEVCLKTLAVKNTLPPYGKPPVGMHHSTGATGSAHGSDAGSGSQQPSKRLYESRRTSELSCGEFGTGKAELHRKANATAVRIPIVGYEVMEERARFTIFKLRIENSISHTCWLVLRRYTDFVRLNNKLKTIFPHCNLVLPRKKWFGDNFSSGFIDNRIQGLQTFINTILGDDVMRTCQAVRDFFCLDEPPSYSESMEESRVIFEAQEETISQLKQQLQAKEDMVQALQTKLATELNRNKILSNVIRNSVENCAKCSKSTEQLMKESVYK